MVLWMAICPDNPLNRLLDRAQEGFSRYLPENVSADVTMILIKVIFSTFLPGIGIGVFFALYDHVLWKWKPFVLLHKIPNLNGKWTATISSPLKGDRHPEIQMEIRQTWNKLQVNGISKALTTTVSESASILEQHGQIFFSYAYWIHQFGGQCYPGFNSLKVEGNRMMGQYFSAKDVVEEFENSCTYLHKKEKTRNQVLGLAKGCGSKGMIEFTRQ